MSETSYIPLNWMEASLEEIIPQSGVFCDGDWVESKDQDPDGNIRLIQLADIGDGRFVDKSDRYLTKNKARELNCTFLEAGDLLIARMPDPLGRACIFPLCGHEKYVTVVDVCIVRVSGAFIASKFLMYLINSPRIREQIEEYKTGSTRKRISRGNLAKIVLTIPPLNEQKRIVTKIEELFSELDKGIESLKTAREQLKVYRQAVLKHAFEGKLTARWREQNKDKLETADQLLERIGKEREVYHQQQLREYEDEIKIWKANEKEGVRPKPPKRLEPIVALSSEKALGLPELPNGWQWATLSWMLSFHRKPMTTGPFGTMLSKNEHTTSGIPVLGIENIGEGKFLYGNKIFVTEQKAQELRAFEVEATDVIISRSGTVGEICEVPSNLGKALISTNLLRISLNHDVMISYFFVLLFHGAAVVKKQIKELCKGSSRDFLNQSILSSLLFPLPSLDEQDTILKQIASRLSWIENLEGGIENALQRSEALRQSILKKAFSGKLVAQDPNDEPASVLLERIRAEKEAQSSKKEPQQKQEADSILELATIQTGAVQTSFWP